MDSYSYSLTLTLTLSLLTSLSLSRSLALSLSLLLSLPLTLSCSLSFSLSLTLLVSYSLSLSLTLLVSYSFTLLLSWSLTLLLSYSLSLTLSQSHSHSHCHSLLSAMVSVLPEALAVVQHWHTFSAISERYQCRGSTVFFGSTSIDAVSMAEHQTRALAAASLSMQRSAGDSKRALDDLLPPELGKEQHMQASKNLQSPKEIQIFSRAKSPNFLEAYV